MRGVTRADRIQNSQIRENLSQKESCEVNLQKRFQGTVEERKTTGGGGVARLKIMLDFHC